MIYKNDPKNKEKAEYRARKEDAEVSLEKTPDDGVFDSLKQTRVERMVEIAHKEAVFQRWRSIFTQRGKLGRAIVDLKKSISEIFIGSAAKLLVDILNKISGVKK